MFKKSKMRENLEKKNRLIAKEKPTYTQVTYTSRKDGIKHIKFEDPERYIFLSDK